MSHKILFDPAFDNSGQGPVKVPGYGLPINYTPDVQHVEGGTIEGYTGKFRYGAADFVPERMVVREVAMLRIMNDITEKPDWEKKVFDEEIVTKWKTEALQQQDDLSESAFAWALRELREKTKSSVTNKFVTVLDNASACVKSDVLVSKTLQDELKENVKPLMDHVNPDWHPGSFEKVRNLVHPSLFPLVYGRSRVLASGTVGMEDCIEYVDKGEVIPVPENPWAEENQQHRSTKALWSRKFQWLPCEVKFDGMDGTGVKITSYINNLHPVKYKSLYETVEKLIALSIKPWNEILICGNEGRNPLRIKTYGVEILDGDQPEWADSITSEDEVSDDNLKKIREYLALPDGPHYDAEDESDEEHIPDNWEELEGWELWEVVHAKTLRRRTYIHPEPEDSHTYEEWKQGITRPVIPGYKAAEEFKHEYYTINLEKDFRDRGLQVIVKIAGIELTPEKPSYEGGNWHLEGMINEHIVATSIYYYDVDNITTSGIRFRQEASLPDEDLSYEQNDHAPLETIFGTPMTDEPAVQEFGHLYTPDGRFIAFPNTLQHCVQPFELADKSKPGHRRFIVLWLVDPHMRVMSTANVPPQQHDWWAEEAQKKSGITMPPEVMEMIMANTENWPMGLEEAKELRLELMKERTHFGQSVEQHFDSYYLCEH